jgi:hypothetical protein
VAKGDGGRRQPCCTACAHKCAILSAEVLVHGRAVAGYMWSPHSFALYGSISTWRVSLTCICSAVEHAGGGMGRGSGAPQRALCGGPFILFPPFSAGMVILMLPHSEATWTDWRRPRHVGCSPPDLSAGPLEVAKLDVCRRTGRDVSAREGSCEWSISACCLYHPPQVHNDTLGSMYRLRHETRSRRSRPCDSASYGLDTFPARKLPEVVGALHESPSG